jgi:hypothetical protein
MVSKYELAIQVIVILASNVGLKIVAGYDLIRIKEDLDGVLN